MSSSLTRVRSVFGPMIAYANDHVTRHIADYGAHTRPEIAFLLSAVRAGDAIFDLGAHIGSFTIPLAQKAGPAGRVLAVEAVAASARILAANADLNGLSERVEVRCALLAPSGAFEPVHEDANTGATFFRASAADWDGEVATIDTLAAATFIPDVIKIDLEGFEAWALTASAVVASRKPVLYAEVSAGHLARAGGSAAALWDHLRGLGYRLFRNAGARNAADDRFDVRELRELSEGGAFFDVLAIHRDDPRAGAYC